jgi:hypothetical protein
MLIKVSEKIPCRTSYKWTPGVCIHFSRHSPNWQVVWNFHSPNQKTTGQKYRKGQWEGEKPSPVDLNFYLPILNFTRIWQVGEWLSAPLLTLKSNGWNQASLPIFEYSTHWFTETARSRKTVINPEPSILDFIRHFPHLYHCKPWTQTIRSHQPIKSHQQSLQFSISPTISTQLNSTNIYYPKHRELLQMVNRKTK